MVLTTRDVQDQEDYNLTIVSFSDQWESGIRLVVSPGVVLFMYKHSDKKSFDNNLEATFTSMVLYSRFVLWDL